MSLLRTPFQVANAVVHEDEPRHVLERAEEAVKDRDAEILAAVETLATVRGLVRREELLALLRGDR